MVTSLRLACLLAVGHVTASFDLKFARATSAADNAPIDVGWSPAPTGAPVQVPNIFEKRLLAAYNTCGFISGLACMSDGDELGITELTSCSFFINMLAWILVHD